jgi:hypothetical protein
VVDGGHVLLGWLLVLVPLARVWYVSGEDLLGLVNLLVL